MANNISFAPQTAFVSERAPLIFKSRGMGLFFKAAILLFFASLLLLGGSFVYKRTAEKEIDSLSLSLERAKNVFDLPFISQMEDLGARIPIVKETISSHRFSGNIFDFLEESTIKEVGYSNFSYSYQTITPQASPSFMKKSSGEQTEVSVSLSGKAKDYTSLVQQAEIFKKNDKISTFLFSNFSLTPEGNVSFSLNLVFNPIILYGQERD